MSGPGIMGAAGAAAHGAATSERESGNVLELSIRPEIAQIPVATDAVLAAIGRAQNDVLGAAAMGEALLNAIVYGALQLSSASQRDAIELQAAIRRAEASAGAIAPVRVSVRRVPQGHAVTICDPGDGFDWRSVLARAADADGVLLDEGGRGLMIIRAACREIAYNDAGNELTLIFDDQSKAAPEGRRAEE